MQLENRFSGSARSYETSSSSESSTPEVTLLSNSVREKKRKKANCSDTSTNMALFRPEMSKLEERVTKNINSKLNAMGVVPREVEDTYEPENNASNWKAEYIPMESYGESIILTTPLHLYIHPLLFLLHQLQHNKKWLQSKIGTTDQAIALQSI